MAQQEVKEAEKSELDLFDAESVEPLRPSKDGNSSSASSSGSGRLSPLSGDFDLKQHSSAVEQMILAASKGSRQAMGNLRGGAQPFSALKKEVKENLMVRNPDTLPASAAGVPADADSSATAKAQHPKSRCVQM